MDEHCETPSHWNSAKTLDAWLEDNGIVGICGVDTRRLTQQIRCCSVDFTFYSQIIFNLHQLHGREHGTMLGKIVVGDSQPNTIKQLDPSKENVVAQVSTKVSQSMLVVPEFKIVDECFHYCI